MWNHKNVSGITGYRSGVIIFVEVVKNQVARINDMGEYMSKFEDTKSHNKSTYTYSEMWNCILSRIETSRVAINSLRFMLVFCQYQRFAT